MIWAKWQGTVTAAVVGASVAFGQSSVTTSLGDSTTGECITLREPGKPDTRCRVVRSLRQPNGFMSYEVQAIDSGEAITVVELGAATNVYDTPNGMSIRGVPSHIYHWGQAAHTAMATQDASARCLPSVPINDRCPVVTASAWASTGNTDQVIQQAGYNSTGRAQYCPNVPINDGGPVSTSSAWPSTRNAGQAIQQVGYNGSEPMDGASTPMAAMPVSSSVPVTETLDAPPPPPGVKSNGLLRRLFRRDGDETIANQAPMSRNITPGGIDSDLSGLGTKPVLAAGENLDKAKFVVPGSVLPTPNSPPPLPPGVMPLPRQYPSLQYATQVPGAMPSSAAGNPEMANPFVPMQNQSAPNWSPSESNAFARPTEDLVPPPQIAEAGRRGMLRRLLHRDANQEPVPTNTAGTGDSALAANGFATSGLNNSMEGLPSSQPRVLPASMTSAQTQSVLDGDCGQSLASLHNSMLPSQREMAADALATTDWRSNPAVVSALLRSAREDPAPTVRSACVRSLVKMNVNSGVAVSTLQALKFDTDMQVRSDANAALAVLAASASANQGIQPTSFVGHSPSK